MNNATSNITAKGIFFLLLAISATLPFSVNLNSFLIILLVVVVIINKISEKNLSFKNISYLIPALVLFSIYLYGLVVAENKLEEFKGLERKLSLLVLPLALSASPLLGKKKSEYIMLAFVLSCFAVSALVFREGFDFLYAEHRGWALDELLLIHRPFLGMYVVACLFFLTFLFLQTSRLVVKGLYLLLFLFFLVFLFILGAKMAVLALFFSAFSTGVLILLRKRKYSIVLSICLVTIACAIGLYLSSNSIQIFLHTLLNLKDFSYTEYDAGMMDSFNVRFGIWKCCKAVLASDHIWLTGAGLYDSKLLLIQCYIDNEFAYQAEFKFDPHNQFLEIWLNYGIFVLLIFIVALVFVIRHAYKQRNFLFISFLLIIIICGLTESILNSQKGIVFFSLFYALFAFQFTEKDKKEKLYVLH